jgi:SAM-dependent methyltransferase
MRLLKRLVFYIDYLRIKRQAKAAGMYFPFGKLYPCLDERNADSGSASGHYFHQDLLVARRIFKNNPQRHVDIGSRIDGFIAHVAVFREIEVFDIRPLNNVIPNIIFKQFDLMSNNFRLKNYCDSVSSLHAIEHFGLGRYGDKLDYNGHLKGLKNIYKMLKKNGKFYFSVPIVPQRIEFNAHRVFSVKYLIKLIQDKYRIDSFSYVNDEGDLLRNVSLNPEDFEKHYGCKYGCGIFELTKITKSNSLNSV